MKEKLRRRKAKVGLVSRLTCLVFLIVINGKCMKKFVNLRTVVILFIYLLLIKRKKEKKKKSALQHLVKTCTS